MITSLSNPRVRFVKDLNDKAKTRKKEGLFTALPFLFGDKV